MNYDSKNSASITQARAKLQSDKLEEAQSILEQALEEDPYNIAALELLGYTQFLAGRHVDCEASNRKVLHLEPNRAYALKGLGMALVEQGKIEEGIGQLENAITARPGEGDHYWDLAVILKDAGRIDDCKKVAGRALENAAPSWHTRFTNLRSTLDK